MNELKEANDLARRLMAGDESALESAMRDFGGMVRGRIRAQGVTESEIEDAEQAAWLRVWNGRQGLSNEAALPSWLGQIASNTAKNFTRHGRTLKRAAEVTETDWMAAWSRIGGENPDPEAFETSVPSPFDMSAYREWHAELINARNAEARFDRVWFDLYKLREIARIDRPPHISNRDYRDAHIAIGARILHERHGVRPTARTVWCGSVMAAASLATIGQKASPAIARKAWERRRELFRDEGSPGFNVIPPQAHQKYFGISPNWW
ncbi:RNA polymerase sigma factor [Natronospira bacteriovora]|uniref:Sigma factor n=1 Tax=Natronospira bacteriovora TaxID=3069753 RepID=A0ABU0W5L0_9GAMM|nr:hypothetical protein [Natronospira sp. AB-CW4]MDQ2069058.1 sigma factor [Natronospira sp. AB-CW4]